MALSQIKMEDNTLNKYNMVSQVFIKVEVFNQLRTLLTYNM